MDFSHGGVASNEPTIAASNNSAAATASGEPSEALPPLWPYLLLCAATAACIDLGHLHQLHDGDSLVPILVSLQRWTPFYWGQDRFGMLLPLIARPIHHPFFNLLVQEWLGVFSGLAVFFLLARYTLRNRLWPAAGTVSAVFFLAFVAPPTRFLWFTELPYASSTALAIGALLVLEQEWRGRRATAVLLIALASWTNLAVCVPLIPVVLFRSMLDNAGQETGTAQKTGLLTRLAQNRRSLAMLVFGVFAGRALTNLAKGAVKTPLGTVPIGGWANAWTQFAISTWHGLGLDTVPLVTVLVAPVFLGVVSLWPTPQLGKGKRDGLTAAVSLGTAGALFWFLVGTLEQTRANLYFPRYAFPSLLFFGVMLAILAVAPLGRVSSPSLSRWALPVSTVLLFAATLGSYGFPSVSAVRRDLDQRCGAATEEILTTRANIIAGNYWKVWAAVYHANLVLYERRAPQRIFGVTDRGRQTWKYWAKLPMDQLRVAAFAGDEAAEYWLRDYNVPLVRNEHYSQIDIFSSPPALSNRP